MTISEVFTEHNWHLFQAGRRPNPGVIVGKFLKDRLDNRELEYSSSAPKGPRAADVEVLHPGTKGAWVQAEA